MKFTKIRWLINQQTFYQKVFLVLVVKYVGCEDFNNLLPDGSYSFGYNNPDSYHQSQANTNNVVGGEFGSRNPGTGAIDSLQYTAGPRGFRPRGKNVVRKYDFNQVRTGPIGSPNDPFFDPNEDPSYNFAFNTRTYNRQEAANRVGDVAGKFSYLDDIGERHNVEFIAGRNTGYHVKSATPDNKALPFSPLQYVGKRRPVPRGRTTVQRGLDGSYRFVSGGPDHRRTETSDATGHVRGSYTYLDDKGVRHSVHYIAGPETGYRVLKNVKGPHLPTIFPFGGPDIVPPDFYDYPLNPQDLFDTAASGHIKPQNGFKPASQNTFNTDTDSNGNQDGVFGSFDNPNDKNNFDLNVGSTSRPGFDKKKPFRPSYEDDGSDVGDIFGGSSTTDRTVNKPQNNFEKDDGFYRPTGDDGSYKPSGEDGAHRPSSFRPSVGDGSLNPNFFRPSADGKKYPPNAGGLKPNSFNTNVGTGEYDGLKPDSFRPNADTNLNPTRPESGGKPSIAGSNFGGTNYDEYSNEVNNFDLFNAGGGTRPSSGSSNRPILGNDDSYIEISQSGGNYNDRGTLVTNVGDKLFSVPPGVSVRAHVQAIDLAPLKSRTRSPTDQLNAETSNVKIGNSNVNQSETVIYNISTNSSTNATTAEQSGLRL